MKRFLTRIKNNGGFTLTETLIALMVFAIMMLILMNLLAFSLQQKQKNEETIQSMDSQVENLASGGEMNFEAVLAEYGEIDGQTGDILFYGMGGAALTVDVPACVLSGTPCPPTPPCSCSTSPQDVKIEGSIAGIFDDDEHMRITRPVFGGWNEFDSITDYNGDPTGKFFSNMPAPGVVPTIREFLCIDESCPDPLCNDMDHQYVFCGDAGCVDPLCLSLGHNIGVVTWIIDLNYNKISATDDRNFVTYLLLPVGATDVVADAAARNCSAHVMTGTLGSDDITAVRIMNLSGSWARVKVSFRAPPPPSLLAGWGSTAFYSYFSGGINSARTIELQQSLVDPDGKNFITATDGVSLPERPCRLHGTSSCLLCNLPDRY